MLVAKNHSKTRSRCLVHEFSFIDIFNSIYHGYKAALLKKNPFWPLSFYMDVASYCYYEKVRRTIRTAIVLYFHSFSAAELIIWRVRTKFWLKNFHTMRVIFEIAMIKIFNICQITTIFL